MLDVEYSESGGYKVGRVRTASDHQWVVVFSDLQLGHPGFDEKVFRATVEFAKENDAVCIGLGDWMENGTKSSVGKSWVEQRYSPSQQRKLLVEWMKPIAAQFVAICPGNHDLRGESETDLDALEWVAESLGVEYFPTEIMLVLHARDEHNHGASYTIYANHSRTGGKNSSTIAAAVKRDWAFVQADVKLKGHDHHLQFDHDNVLVLDGNKAAAREQRQYIGLCGSCLQRAGSYATVKPYAPADVGQLAMCFDMRRGKRDVQPRYIWG